MHKSIDRFRNCLAMTWDCRRRITWTDSKPTPDKAFVLAVFSKIAYLEVPRYELQHHSIAKIIPCLTYQQIVTKELELDVLQLLAQSDLGETFVVSSNGIVAVSIIRPEVIIISLRGTRALYLSDWMTDLRFGQIRVNTSGGSFGVHGGFFETVMEFAERLAIEVQKRVRTYSSPPPIYLTGHSLGGAAAAIISMLDGHVFFSRLRGGYDVSFRLPVHSTYTYGMPRYCSLSRATSNPDPIHTLQLNDVVPSLPPAWLSYAESPQEYAISAGRWLPLGKRPPLGFDAWMSRLGGLRGMRSHFIEGYIRLLKTVV
jgi:hypothetical protein